MSEVAAPAAPAAPASILGTPAAPAAPATPAAPSSWNWAGEDGKFSEGWIDKLPEDLRANPSLRVIDSIPNLAKSYAATKAMVGTKLTMPAPDAPAEAIAHWRTVTGAPDKPEGYLGDKKTLRPDDFPEQYWDAEGEKSFLALAHKHSLPPHVVQELAAFDAARMKAGLDKGQAQFQQSVEAETAKLKSEWGADFDSKINLAKRMAVTVGLDPQTSEFFTKADGVKAMLNMAKLISEDKLVKGDSTQALGASITEQIRDIHDLKSTSHNARAYRGELGPQAQGDAQQLLRRLYDSMEKK